MTSNLLTFSFDVSMEDCIRCYLYREGQMISFIPQCASTILPLIFDTE